MSAAPENWFKEFTSGIAQNIFAGLVLTACGVLCVRFGLTTNPQLNDLSSWRAWGAITICAILLLVGVTITANWLVRFYRRSKVPKAKGDRLAVLIAVLHEDKRGFHRQRLLGRLESEFEGGIQIGVWPDTLDLADDLGALARTQASKKAQSWLRSKNFDLLIWGYVLADQSITLRFTVREEDGHRQDNHYALLPNLTLPPDFEDDFAAVLAARVAIEVTPAASAVRFISPQLRRSRARLKLLLGKAKNSEAKGSLSFSYGLLCAVIAQQDGTNDDMNEAVIAFHAALEVYTRNDFHAQWAMTQNSLGLVLWNLGGRLDGQAGSDSLVASEEAYRAALEVYTRNDFPSQWAMAQNNLGLVLRTLGERLDGQEGLHSLKASEVAYRTALEIYTRKGFPAYWATTQNNLGIVLSDLGGRLDGQEGLKSLKASEVAYRAALEVYSRKDFPADWAMTQNNLGAVLCDLERRLDGQEGLDNLKAAEVAFRAALQVYTRKDFPAQWATTQNNLGLMLCNLGRRLGGQERLGSLKASEVALRAALEVRIRKDLPFDWAQTQENIAILYQALYSHTNDKNWLVQGLEAAKGALDVYQSMKADFYINKTTRLRDRCKAKLDEADGSSPP